jgi:adhesin HecA-like repeat protein
MLEVARQLVALADDASHHAPVEPLSEHERRILKLFAEGNNSATIARARLANRAGFGSARASTTLEPRLPWP